MNDRERTVMATLADGPKTTREIADVLGLPTTRTYKIMISLAKYKFVDCMVIKVTRYGYKTQWRALE